MERPDEEKTTMIVTLMFDLEEEVTPALFITKIAYACARGGALRPGEKVYEIGADHGYEVVRDAPSILGVPQPRGIERFER